MKQKPTVKKASAAEQAAAAVLKKKNGAVKRPTPPPVHPQVALRQHEEELAYRAKRWAELHANPKTREKMDTQLEGLNERDQRRVVLNGQRIAAGFMPKH